MNAGDHADGESRSPLRTLLTIIVMVGVVAILTVFLRTFIFVPYEIPSGSMEETIMTGDMVFSEKVSYYFRKPARGDIVTFADPEVAGRTLIKRVIATEGQEVDLIDGNVTVDGQVLSEPYTNGKQSFPLSHTAVNVDITYPYTVPSGYLWVMGDNRTASQDSRYFGAIEQSSVTGRAALIYWPLSDFKLIS